jgi:myo-inositol-1(or 4)-monophosphatase
MRDAGRGLGALVEKLALDLRESVLPELGSHAGRAHDETGEGGDVTFAIDERAERRLEEWIAEHAPRAAFYSEDRGLVRPGGGEPDRVLVVDPIDGTRPAMAGFESACVSVAAAPLGAGEPVMGDVDAACVLEIKSGERFVAERGRGLRSDRPVRLSQNTNLDRLFWVYGFRGRPARAYAEVLGDLLDRSSVGGATFDLGSATYDMTRVLTGQLDAYVEPGPRLLDEVPGMREEFERVGGGQVLNNSPYDLAAAALCLREGGAVVADARGRPLEDRPLLGSGAEYQMSVIGCTSPELLALLVEEVDRGIARLRAGTSPASSGEGAGPAVASGA